MSQLPIDAVLPALRQTLASQTRAVLQAPPGAGKTTRVPLALLDAPWLAGRKIIMLEPRRLATRAAANFMACRLGERVGQQVGYRVRLDSQVGSQTRIEVVTEGILTRMLQQDPALSSVGLVIFDEFHERHLQADLGLALCLESQAALREDLRILVMSATLDGERVSVLMEGAPLLRSEGRCYPVSIRYLPATPSSGRGRGEWVGQVSAAVLRALDEERGSVLVFLPGAREIKQVESLLRGAVLAADVVLAPLYGNLAQEAQVRAIAPAPAGQRKVVLATNIAETSLTIEGIRVVIDAGLVRVPKFEPRSGMTRLETIQVSQASADQRAGRAGRLAPGVCYRLWPEGRSLIPHSEAEICTADLTALVLELAQWGTTEPAELAWLDPPAEASVAQARELLIRLGALDRHGRITRHGQQIAQLALHPRLAHMVIKGKALGLGALACDLAALLCERDILRTSADSNARRDADILARLPLLQGEQSGAVDRGAIKRVHQSACQWRQILNIAESSGAADFDKAGLLLGLAYPDRIAQRRGESGGRFLLANGRGAKFHDADGLAQADYLAVAQLEGGRDAHIFLAAKLELSTLECYFGELVETVAFVRWDSALEAVSARQQQRLGAIVVADKALDRVEPETLVAAMLEGVAQLGIGALPWDRQCRQWQARVQFLRRIDGNAWPDVSDEALMAEIKQWLAPFLNGVSRRAHLQKIDLMAALSTLLFWSQQRTLDEQAPTHLVVPSGSRIAVDYSNQPPVLAVRLQEMFGARQTPTLAGGRVKVLLHLLSPARRPLQVTQDLAGFWCGSYLEVKKEMKGRYPKHFWPDDPQQALPTARVKPRSK